MADILTNTVTNTLTYISSKPGLVVLITQSAFVASLLAVCHVITIITGAVAGTAGAIVGIHSLYHKVWLPWRHRSQLRHSKVKPKKQ